ncbi:DUF3923 family protein [Companilactobacillus hulinensis]|uniref:DUF3923 family protein n=1 Tax=Companilactobacillus hulinensis TaxID=2486007 RepID=UPI000F792580|nr:DUF3923 family protein [Companilactobacillus hulinensis]
MKKIWRIINIAWIIIFVFLTILILLRKIDGTGAVQTTQARLVSLGVLAVFAIIIILCQIIWLRVINRK